MLIVKNVIKGSIATKLNIKRGDKILAFNGYEANDILDYWFYDSQSEFTIKIIKSKREKLLKIVKNQNESLGLEFISDNLEVKTCKNKCVFCFVDQMPPNMRETLYVKDDDYRQSFICGNFVTLTNLIEKDVERIKRLKISPLYISVHTMNGELRKKMLNNRFADKISEYISDFAKEGITMHTQVVLVPGMNDGKELDFTARELFKFYPYVKTLAVVPCGITKFRDNLTQIQNLTQGYANCVIEQTKALNFEFGENFITLGDEFYFKAKKQVESVEFYGDFSQLGNGVGTTAKFSAEINDAIKVTVNNKKYLTVCGESAENFIKEKCRLLEQNVKGLSIKVLAVKNKFFGETINCTGLLTGGDILNAVLSDGGNYDGLVIPDVCLRQFENVFLDDMKLSELEEKCGIKIYVTDGTGESFVNTFSGVVKE